MTEEIEMIEQTGPEEEPIPAEAPEAVEAPEPPAPVREIEVASVKFRNRGKAYYFAPGGLSLRAGDRVVVQTSKGLELGNVLQGNHPVAESKVVQPLRPVVRAATPEDLRVEEQCRVREREAFVIGKQKIAAHGLEMKLVDVECSFEGNKILFFFSSDGRVDFRELVKDLAGVFRTRIELRQIGVRDEARMMGGLGICGRPFCCGCFMDEFAPVSTKMAKTQSMSLNPAKISGCCGRLMCCLRYEQPAYEELVKNVPKNGAFVETPDGYGNVTQVNVLRQTVKVKLDGDDSFRMYDAEDVAAVPGGRPRDGSEPPHVLVLKPKKPKEPEPPADTGWEMPERLITTEEERAAERARRAERAQRAEREQQPRKNNRSRTRREGQENAGQNRQGGKNRQYSKNAGQPAGPAQERQEGEKTAAPKSKKNYNNKRQNPNQKQRAARPGPQEGGEPKSEQKSEQRSKKPYYKHYRHKKSGGDGAPKQQGG